ncbi:MAG: H/ACA ribonucleoprotein complex subunit GAR1 [Candidatus Asgardarchaeia archaeon]
MKKVGKTLHVTSNGLIIVSTKSPPKIGSKVVNKKMEVIGTVFDIIGPVNSPFAVIKPKSKKYIERPPDVLYAIEERKRKGWEKKRKRK